MSASARLSLPFLSPGQAQKEFFHNEALQTLDLLVAPAVEEGPRDAPPASPNIGACYLVGASPSGDWVGKSMCIAGYTSGGWRLIQPTEGMTAYTSSPRARRQLTVRVRGKSPRVSWRRYLARAVVQMWMSRRAPRSNRFLLRYDITALSKANRFIILVTDLQLMLFSNRRGQSRTCAATGALIMCSRGSN